MAVDLTLPGGTIQLGLLLLYLLLMFFSLILLVLDITGSFTSAAMIDTVIGVTALVAVFLTYNRKGYSLRICAYIVSGWVACQLAFIIIYVSSSFWDSRSVSWSIFYVASTGAMQLLQCVCVYFSMRLSRYIIKEKHGAYLRQSVAVEIHHHNEPATIPSSMPLVIEHLEVREPGEHIFTPDDDDDIIASPVIN